MTTPDSAIKALRVQAFMTNEIVKEILKDKSLNLSDSQKEFFKCIKILEDEKVKAFDKLIAYTDHLLKW